MCFSWKLLNVSVLYHVTKSQSHYITIFWSVSHHVRCVLRWHVNLEVVNSGIFAFCHLVYWKNVSIKLNLDLKINPVQLVAGWTVSTFVRLLFCALHHLVKESLTAARSRLSVTLSLFFLMRALCSPSAHLSVSCRCALTFLRPPFTLCWNNLLSVLRIVRWKPDLSSFSTPATFCVFFCRVSKTDPDPIFGYLLLFIEIFCLLSINYSSVYFERE